MLSLIIFLSIYNNIYIIVFIAYNFRVSYHVDRPHVYNSILHNYK